MASSAFPKGGKRSGREASAEDVERHNRLIQQAKDAFDIASDVDEEKETAKKSPCFQSKMYRSLWRIKNLFDFEFKVEGKAFLVCRYFRPQTYLISL